MGGRGQQGESVSANVAPRASFYPVQEPVLRRSLGGRGGLIGSARLPGKDHPLGEDGATNVSLRKTDRGRDRP